MVGAFQVNAWVAAGAALGVILSAAYALTLYRKVAFGNIENPKLDGITDLDAREWVTFIPLIIATLVMGFAPTTCSISPKFVAEAISPPSLGAAHERP
jgi:NADH-quinone oxidoreductase subunit M